MPKTYAKIIGTGRYIPSHVTPNSHFLSHKFFTRDGKLIEEDAEVIIQKFRSITGIENRRYVNDSQTITSHIGFLAAAAALHDANLEPKDLDYIIFAHNFGDIVSESDKVNLVPSFAARVKKYLDVKNPNVIAHHLIMGDSNSDDLNRLRKMIGLGKSDILIPINNHDESDMNQVAEWLLDDSGIDKESLTSIIVADNMGKNPCLANEVKVGFEIKNPNVLAHDLLFGCPGWLEGVIFADKAIRSGAAKRVLVIGAEALSRVCDPHDRDSMIYADGAGAVILEAMESHEPTGILAYSSRSDTDLHLNLLTMGPSNNLDRSREELFLKMDGNEVYQYALSYVPGLVKECLEKSSIPLGNIAKLLIHQANAKMDEKILQGLFNLYGKKRNEIPSNIMPMTIQNLGNSSVATIPTLLDLLLKKELPGHEVRSGEILLFASVGAGMNINAMVYKLP